MKEAQRQAGRPPFQPTDEERQRVEFLVAIGTPRDMICKLITRTDRKGIVHPIAKETLDKHFGPELDTGLAKANARVARSLFQQAVGAPAEYDSDGNLLRAEMVPAVAPAIFWMKARAGWSEKVRVENTGRDGGPMEFKFDLSDASPAELLVLERFLARKAAEARPANDVAA